MATRIQVRRGTTSQWNTANPTLEEGEIGYNSTLGQIKVGDGTSVWADLDYFVSDTSLGTSLGSYVQDSDKGAINGVAELDGSKNILAPASIIFEGTANDHETTLAVTDPTADRTITFPDATGTVALTTDISVTAASTTTFSNKSISLASNTVTSTLAQLNTAISDADVATLAGTETLTNKTLTSPTLTTPNIGVASGTSLTLTGDLTVQGTTTTIDSTTIAVKNAFVFEGATTNDFETTLTVTDPTADRTITLPDSTGTVALTSDITVTPSSTNTLTNKTLTSPKINEDVAVTATATELNYVDGVTSAIQTQLDGKVDESLFDAKGDILVASADNTPAKLGVGTNGYILTANSGATNGIEWAAAPISLPSQTDNSGKYLTTDGSTASWGTVSSYSAPTIGSTSIASGATVTTIAGLTLSNATLSGSLTAGGGTGTSGQVLASTGSGVQWSTPSAGAAFSEFMLIGC
jgi:hypothetical protein